MMLYEDNIWHNFQRMKDQQDKNYLLRQHVKSIV